MAVTGSIFPGQPGSTYATTRELRVYEPSMDWYNRYERYRLIEALAGGTYEMRAGGELWLPREPRELPRREQDGSVVDPYQTRLKGSVCPPLMARLESMLTGMLTRKPIRLEGTSTQITEQLFNVDRRGNDLQRWFSIVARILIRYGYIGTLVDFPRGENGEAIDGRPYWIRYTPKQILDKKVEPDGFGEVITMLRLHETMTVPYKEFGEEVVEQVRVLEPGSFRLFRKQASKSQDWEEVDNGPTTLGYIPFATAQVDEDLRPPLEEVAWLNLQAYQRGSDVANQLHLAAVPRLMLYGFPAEVDEIEAGPDQATGCPSDARAEFLEPGGTSYQWQFKHLEEIERQVNALGLAAVIGQKLTAETAEAKAIDRSQGDSALQVVAHQLQDMIDNCLRFHAAYINDPQPGSCIVSRDFVSAKLEPAQVEALIKLEGAGKITQQTLLTLLAEGEWMGDDFDVEQEVSDTEAIQATRQAEMDKQLEGALGNMQNKPPTGLPSGV